MAIKKITLHAGHNKAGLPGSGASDYLDESTQCRWLRKKIVPYLKKGGIKVVNTTVNNGTSQGNVLARIVKACNDEADVDINVSLHMNACTHSKKDGKTKGVEVLIRPLPGDDKNYTKTKKTLKYKVAKKICEEISSLGFTNRGVKFNTGLYFLNKTTKPALLVEVCFVDDFDDAALFKLKKNEIAEKIAKSILYFK